ncbi:hypothetical protein MIR68_003864 [Amoeboaphelidium protococcarum]|nr:hypothetical protein MIR68_003864 [Amoeboaphelidium protococcarum]
MATGYALFICWLLLWQNCLFPTIQAVRFGAFHNAGSSAMVQGGQSAGGVAANGEANFDSIIHQFTGGDRELLSAIKQIASNTAQRVPFSLDGVVDHLIRMAPKMKAQSHKMVIMLQQRISGQNPQQMFSHFLQKATGQSGQADEVMSILQSHQQDPYRSTGRLAQFVSGQDTFLKDCIQNSRKLQAFIEVPRSDRNYYRAHLWAYPDVQVQALFIVTMILLALWVASLLVGCTTRNKLVYGLSALFRVLVVFYCFAFVAIMMALTSRQGVYDAVDIYIGFGLVGAIVSLLYAQLEIVMSDEVFKAMDIERNSGGDLIDDAIVAAVQSGQDTSPRRQIELPEMQRQESASNSRFYPTVEDVSAADQDLSPQRQNQLSITDRQNSAFDPPYGLNIRNMQ